MSIRKDDTVQVICGEDSGKTGRVLRVMHDKEQLVVEGINRVHKHLKPNRQNPRGGRLLKEMPINISNVLLFCQTCRRGTRIGRRYGADGHKERYCKKCSTTFPGSPLSKPRAKYAR